MRDEIDWSIRFVRFYDGPVRRKPIVFVFASMFLGKRKKKNVQYMLTTPSRTTKIRTDPVRMVTIDIIERRRKSQQRRTLLVLYGIFLHRVHFTTVGMYLVCAGTVLVVLFFPIVRPPYLVNSILKVFCVVLALHNIGVGSKRSNTESECAEKLPAASEQVYFGRLHFITFIVPFELQ